MNLCISWTARFWHCRVAFLVARAGRDLLPVSFANTSSWQFIKITLLSVANDYILCISCWCRRYRCLSCVIASILICFVRLNDAVNLSTHTYRSCVYLVSLTQSHVIFFQWFATSRRHFVVQFTWGAFNTKAKWGLSMEYCPLETWIFSFSFASPMVARRNMPGHQLVDLSPTPRDSFVLYSPKLHPIAQ